MSKIVTRNCCSVYQRNAIVNAKKVRVYGPNSIVNGNRCIVLADHATVLGKHCIIYGAFARVIGKRAVFANTHAWNTAVEIGKKATLLRKNDVAFQVATKNIVRGSGVCSVCIDEMADLLLLPCRHLTTCTSCYRKMQHRTTTTTTKCPICKSSVEQTLKIHVN